MTLAQGIFLLVFVVAIVFAILARYYNSITFLAVAVGLILVEIALLATVLAGQPVLK